MSEPMPVRDAAGLRGYLAAREDRCEAILPTGRSLGLYNNVGAALAALREAKTPSRLGGLICHAND